MSTPRQEIESATQAISTAALLINSQRPTIEAFLKECRNMENYGHIVDPTLYKNPERRAVSALLAPIFKAALAFAAAHDDHVAKAKAALEKVRAA